MLELFDCQKSESDSAKLEDVPCLDLVTSLHLVEGHPDTVHWPLDVLSLDAALVVDPESVGLDVHGRDGAWMLVGHVVQILEAFKGDLVGALVSADQNWEVRKGVTHSFYLKCARSAAVLSRIVAFRSRTGRGSRGSMCGRSTQHYSVRHRCLLMLAFLWRDPRRF